MKVVAKAAVLGLAGLAAVGVTGCNRGGGAGSATTVVQQGAAGAAIATSPSSSSGATAGVTPINDPKELCHQVLVKTRGLSNAVQAFWKVVAGRSGWSDTDLDVSDAVSRVAKESEQVFPSIDGIVGKGASGKIADSSENYLRTLKIFSNAITEQQDSSALNSAASNFGHAKDALTSDCNATG
ncbi:MAG: hypothetical protein ACRC20_13765 [Segniliparus sp.]|uniref:hypothetical protein n=1 Tax=Segniliparus sp. TaxID=2804064 RepID=UPI003F3265E3